jgi:peroxiredoxin
VLDAEGKPAAGAIAWFATETLPALAADRDAKPGRWHEAADRDGKFQVMPGAGEKWAVLLTHERGYALLKGEAWHGGDVKLTPWAKLEGTIFTGGKPAAGVRVGISQFIEVPDIRTDASVTTDDQGHYLADRLREVTQLLEVIEQHDRRGMELARRKMQLELKPGQHVKQDIGVGGRELVAQLAEGGPGTEWTWVRVRRGGVVRELPAEWNKKTQKEKRAWWAEFMKTEEGKKYAKDSQEDPVTFGEATWPTAPGGRVRFEGLPTGVYTLSGFQTGRVGGELDWDFVVKESDGGPVDLGLLFPTPLGPDVLPAGSAAPEISGVTPDGKPFKLSDLRGKWVVLDFWGTWCGFCKSEMPTIRDAWDAYKGSGKVVVVGVSVDDTADEVKTYVDGEKIDWPQVVLGKRAGTDVPQKYGVDGYPTVMLISPDGKVVDKYLRGRVKERVKQAVEGGLP